MIRSVLVDYNPGKYKFRERVEAAVGSPLERLHDVHTYEHFERETDQKTVLHEGFYRLTEGPEWKAVYAHFIGDVARWFGESIIYQRVPTFRVAFPGNVSVGEWHKDAQEGYNHSTHEVNIWVPLTAAHETSAVWCETFDGSDNYVPLNCEYGQVLIFDGANLRHGNKDNETGLTRVSFDLRVIPESSYSEPAIDRKTINTGMAFRLPRAGEAPESCYYALHEFGGATEAEAA